MTSHRLIMSTLSNERPSFWFLLEIHQPLTDSWFNQIVHSQQSRVSITLCTHWEEEVQFYEGSITDVWYMGKARKTEAADWEKSLMDFFVIIPETRVLMFRLQLGIALLSKVLLDFVIQMWGGNLKKPQITSKNERLDEEVGAFARMPGAGGAKPGKPCFIISDESFAVAHSGKLWNCTVHSKVGFAT